MWFLIFAFLACRAVLTAFGFRTCRLSCCLLSFGNPRAQNTFVSIVFPFASVEFQFRNRSCYVLGTVLSGVLKNKVMLCFPSTSSVKLYVDVATLTSCITSNFSINKPISLYEVLAIVILGRSNLIQF